MRRAHITAREEFQAETDERAIARARAVYRERPLRLGFDLWNNTRTVHKEPAA
jgi:hypothetical protein